MPLDPSIALDAKPPSSDPLAVAGNVLGIANSAQELQNRQLTATGLQNQIKQFQATFGAQQDAGRIIATSPDLETGLSRLQQNPNYAFMLPTVNQIREQLLTVANIGKTKAETGEAVARTGQAEAGTQEALTAAQRNVNESAKIGTDTAGMVNAGLINAYAGVTDPSQLDEAGKRYLATIPNGSAYVPIHNSYVNSLMPPASLTGDAALAKLRANIGGMLVGTGHNAEAASALLGVPSVTTVGGAPASVRNEPLVPGPGTPAGAGVTPLGAPGGGVPQAGVAPGGGGTASPAPSPVAGNGKPLFAAIPASLPPQNAQTMEAAGQLREQHETSGKEAYDFSQAAKGALADLDNSYDLMARSGSLIQPGAGGPARLAFAKGLNTLASLTGMKLPQDPMQMAAGELATKDALRLATANSKSLLPGQHIAAQTIDESIGATPSLSNTVLGGKLVTASIRAQMQRVEDQYKFENEYQQKHGTLYGADVAFNAAFPPESYADGVLDKFGMKAGGAFKSPQDVLDKVANGYMTREQAKLILKQQFPNGPAQAPASPASAP
jgi:hypothetical protein